MTSFILAAVLLVALVLAVILVPLLRSRARRPAIHVAPALAALRRQRQEIEEDYARGALSAQEREAALADLVERYPQELPAGEAAPEPARSTRPWLAAVVLIVLIPAVAVLLYLKLGSPAALQSAAPSPHAGADGPAPLDLEAAVDLLAKKLEQRPDDVEGWTLLARSRYELGRFADAANAFEKANALRPGDATLLADYADTLGMVQNRSLQGKPRTLIEQALKIDPHQRKALALAASAELNENHIAASLAYWERLRAEFPADSQEAKQVAGIIDNIKSGTTRSTAQQAAEKSESPPVQAAGAALSGKVTLAPALKTKASPEDTVFVFARAVDGPRMPLAIARLTVRDLPKDFTLDDSMGMAGGPKLSGAASVRIEARVSKSGNAMAQAGDLTGASAPTKPGASGIDVVIDHVVQ